MDFTRTIRVSLALVAATALFAPQRLAAQAGTEDIRLTVGKSIVIDYPADVARISTSNPDVVDYVAVTTRELLLQAKAVGFSTLVVWGKSGQRTFYNISVEQNNDPLRKILRETFPREDVQLQSARDVITLNGKVTSQAIADRIGALAAGFARTVVNNLQLAPGAVEKQILLRVKFATLDRNNSFQFAANFLNTGAFNNFGRIGTNQLGGGATYTSILPERRIGITDNLNIFTFFPQINLLAAIQDLQSRNLLQILAEPNIIATDGKDASFLAGGEFPVPVLQGGAQAGSVTIQFREYGIRLNFRPNLTSNGTIKMYVKPEVSSLDQANGVNISGFLIPALATRRFETNVELAEGQSFAIAGLLDDRVIDNLSKLPGAANIPIIGNLFKSRDVRRSKTELIVIVTPEIVTPLQPSDPKPLPNFPEKFLPPNTPPAAAKTNTGWRRRIP